MPSLSFVTTLPAAVYSAIFLFVIKEFVEWRRRRRTDLKKVSVYKRVLAFECERNHWFIKSIRGLDWLDDEEVSHYRIIPAATGRQNYRLIRKNGAEGRGGMLPKVRIEAFEKLAVEAAFVDEELASKVSAALGAVLELQHLRDSVIEFSDDPVMQGGFLRYAKSEAERSFELLSALYKACTGKVLKDHHLR
ncbi:hypothetical protein [Ensifer adhaerens]